MGLWASIKNFFLSPARGSEAAKVMHMEYNGASSMTEHIALWRDIYMGIDDENGINKPSGFASILCNDLAKKATQELRIKTVVGERDFNIDFLNDDFFQDLRQQIEYALAMGGVVMRPFVEADKILFGWYTADRVIPTEWSGRKLKGCILCDYKAITSVNGVEEFYTKLEAHGIDNSDGKYHIKTKVFKNFAQTPDGYTGQEVSLSSVPEWADITPDIVIENPKTETFIYMASPSARNKDLNSPMGVSIFKDATSWIKEIDNAITSASHENIHGRSKLFIDETMIPKKLVKSGDSSYMRDDISIMDQQFYKKMMGEGGTNLIEQWAPGLRFDSYISYINFLLHNCCTLCGIDGGQYVFDEKSYSATATEIISKQQKTYITICDIQRFMIKPVLNDILNCIRQLRVLYNMELIPDDVELVIDFGDSIITDQKAKVETAQNEVISGLRSAYSYLVDIRKLTPQDAEEELKRINQDKAAGALTSIDAIDEGDNA